MPDSSSILANTSAREPCQSVSRCFKAIASMLEIPISETKSAAEEFSTTKDVIPYDLHLSKTDRDLFWAIHRRTLLSKSKSAVCGESSHFPFN